MIPSSEWGSTEITVSYLQLLVCDRIREAATEEARQGWIAVDAWISRRVRELQAKTVGTPASSLPAWVLLPD